MKLSNHRGQVVVLVFFVAGDRPFRNMVPHLRGLVARMEGKPFALLGISGDNDYDELKGIAARERFNWRTCWDNGKPVWLKGGAIFARWDINGTPTIYVLDHHGVIRYKDIEGKQLDDAVATLLKEADTRAEWDRGKSQRVTNELDETVFLGTVTRIDNMDQGPDSFVRWVVTLTIDKVIQGSLPMETFQLAIHSPSQEGVESGHQYRISVRRSGSEYAYCGRHPWLPVPPDSLGPK